MTWGRLYWPWWLGIVLSTFLVAEIYSLATNPQNTLSWWVWNTLKITASERFGQWTAADLLVFCAYMSVFVLWLPWHFFFRRFV